MSYRYRVFGICLVSPLALPELSPATPQIGCDPCDGDQSHDAIREGADGEEVRLVVRAPRPARPAWIPGPEGEPDQKNPDFTIARRHSSLYWPAAGQFDLHAGREVEWTPTIGCAAATMRAFLLGPVLSILLHQRGYLVMHASAAAIQDGNGEWGAVGFVGRSGAGKSTLAAALHARGHRAVSDDALVIPAPDLDSDSTDVPYRPSVFPGYASLRLWPQSLQALGMDAHAHPLLYPAEDRRLLSVETRFLSESVPLRRLYVLDTGDCVGSELLSPGAAMGRLVGNTLCAGLLSPSETAEQFRQCGVLARRLPVYRLRRPRDLSRLDEAAALVEAGLPEEQPALAAASR